MPMQLKIPLHGNPDPLEKMSLWADMSSLNPKGFRQLSAKRNRQRARVTDPAKVGPNGRHLSRPEQLELQRKAAA